MKDIVSRVVMSLLMPTGQVKYINSFITEYGKVDNDFTKRLEKISDMLETGIEEEDRRRR